MTDNEYTIRISADDQLSGILNKLSRNAERDLGGVGQELDKAEKELIDVGRGAERAGRELDGLGGKTEKVDKDLVDLGRGADRAGRELIDLGRGAGRAERELIDLGRGADRTERDLVDLGRGAGIADRQTSRLFRRLRSDSRDSNREILALGRAFRGVFLGALAAVGVASLGSELRAAAGDAAVFGQGIREIATISSGGADEIDALADSVDRLSVQFGRDAPDVARAQYQTLSAGITDTADATELLAQANVLAIGGLARTESTVDLLTTSLNAYGDGVEFAERNSDIFFETVRRGKTTIEELSSAIGPALPLANTLGVELFEVSAALASQTQQGIATTESATQLRALFKSLIKETELIDAVFQRVGKRYDENTVEAEGLQSVLETLRGALLNDAEALEVLGGRIEATTALLTLTGDQADRFADNLEGIEGSAGAAQRAFDIIADGPQFALDRLTQGIASFRREIGTGLLEGFAAGFDGELDGVLDTITDFGRALRPVFAEIASDTGKIASDLASIDGSGLQDVVDQTRIWIADLRVGIESLGVIQSVFTTGYGTVLEIAGAAAVEVGQLLDRLEQRSLTQQLAEARTELNKFIADQQALIDQSFFDDDDATVAATLEGIEQREKVIERLQRLVDEGADRVADQGGDFQRLIESLNEAAEGFGDEIDDVVRALEASSDLRIGIEFENERAEYEAKVAALQAQIQATADEINAQGGLPVPVSFDVSDTALLAAQDALAGVGPTLFETADLGPLERIRRELEVQETLSVVIGDQQDRITAARKADAQALADAATEQEFLVQLLERAAAASEATDETRAAQRELERQAVDAKLTELGIEEDLRDVLIERLAAVQELEEIQGQSDRRTRELQAERRELERTGRDQRRDSSLLDDQRDAIRAIEQEIADLERRRGDAIGGAVDEEIEALRRLRDEFVQASRALPPDIERRINAIDAEIEAIGERAKTVAEGVQDDLVGALDVSIGDLGDVALDGTERASDDLAVSLGNVADEARRAREELFGVALSDEDLARVRNALADDNNTEQGQPFGEQSSRVLGNLGSVAGQFGNDELAQTLSTAREYVETLQNIQQLGQDMPGVFDDFFSLLDSGFDGAVSAAQSLISQLLELLGLGGQLGGGGGFGGFFASLFGGGGSSTPISDSFGVGDIPAAAAASAGGGSYIPPTPAISLTPGGITDPGGFATISSSGGGSGGGGGVTIQQSVSITVELPNVRDPDRAGESIQEAIPLIDQRIREALALQADVKELVRSAARDPMT